MIKMKMISMVYALPAPVDPPDDRALHPASPGAGKHGETSAGKGGSVGEGGQASAAGASAIVQIAAPAVTVAPTSALIPVTVPAL